MKDFKIQKLKFFSSTKKNTFERRKKKFLKIISWKRDICDSSMLVVGTPITQFFYKGKIIQFKSGKKFGKQKQKIVNFYVGQLTKGVLEFLIQNALNSIENSSNSDIMIEVNVEFVKKNVSEYIREDDDLEDTDSEDDTSSGEDEDDIIEEND